MTDAPMDKLNERGRRLLGTWERGEETRNYTGAANYADGQAKREQQQ